MPFPKMSGGIARFLQGTGQHGGFGVEPLSHSPLNVVITITQIGGNFPTLWILTGGYGHAGWGTDGRVDVKLVEANSFLGEPVDMGSVCRFVSKAGKVAPSHIIDKYEDDVRPLSEGRIGKTDEKKEAKNCFH